MNPATIMARKKILRFGLPKGSLQEATIQKMAKAGFNISISSRSYIPYVDDDELEIRLIRAEARAHQGKVTGAGSAQEDINMLRTRAKAPLIAAVTQSQMIDLIEKERVYELAYEGHRWYDLVRTGRASSVMTAFSPNWKDTYNLWPIPQRELQNNPALEGHQNPGY